MSASGRILKFANGGFVEAKSENQGLSVRQLPSNAWGRYGSSRAVRRRMPSDCCQPSPAIHFVMNFSSTALAIMAFVSMIGRSQPLVCHSPARYCFEPTGRPKYNGKARTLGH